MSQQYVNDGDEKDVRSQPVNEPERHEGSHEAAEEATSHADETVTMNIAPRRQRRKSGDKAGADQANLADAEAEETALTSGETDESDLRQLEALGFTPEEALRLIDVSVRISNSNEARDAEATRKRLQFAKWLVEQGVLDEFSLRD